MGQCRGVREHGCPRRQSNGADQSLGPAGLSRVRQIDGTEGKLCCRLRRLTGDLGGCLPQDRNRLLVTRFRRRQQVRCGFARRPTPSEYGGRRRTMEGNAGAAGHVLGDRLADQVVAELEAGTTIS